jgi:RNA polymerase sigma-70 factor (ECF subfamily)
MLERIDRFEKRKAPFSAWLFRIAHNLAIDHFRTMRRLRLQPEPPEPAVAEPSAEEKAFRRIADHRVAELVRGLSEDQRRVLASRLFLGRSNAEIAAELGKTEGAVKALQHRALASIERRGEPKPS